MWIWPFGPRAKKVLEKRRLAREEASATDGQATEQVKESAHANAVDEEDAIDPDEEENTPKSSSPAVVSFHDTTKTEESDEETKPKSLAGKFAAATFNQGRSTCVFIIFFAYQLLTLSCLHLDLEKQSFHESQRAKECWENMTQYDAEVEQLFTFVQVSTT